MPITTSEVPDTAAAVLAFARSSRAMADRGEAELLVAACEWADLHPASSVLDAAAFMVAGSEHEEPVAGPGAPLVAEFCIAEFGAVLRISTVSSKHLIGQALELRHRLPRLWRLVQAGDLPAWRARRIAETTIHADLSREAAAYVDAQLAPFAHRTSTTAVDRLVDAAVARFDPARAALEAARAADGRHVTIDEEQVSFAGTMRVTAELDLADALDFSAAVVQGAEVLKALGSDESLDARRASAVGEMARSQLALPKTHRPRDVHLDQPPRPHLRHRPARHGFETGLRPSSTSRAMTTTPHTPPTPQPAGQLARLCVRVPG